MDIAEREEYIDAFDLDTFREATRPSQKQTFALYVLLKEARKALRGEPVDSTCLQESTDFLMPKRILLPETNKGRTNITVTLNTLFNIKPTWTQDELIAEYGITYDKMCLYIKRMFEIASNMDYLWIQFDPQATSWTLLRKGVAMPRNYTGLLPNERPSIK